MEDEQSEPNSFDEASEEDSQNDPAKFTWFAPAVMAHSSEDEIKKRVFEHIEALIDAYSLDNYKVIILFDDNDQISSYHSNQIYKAASAGKEKDILLLLQSPGGSIEPAYFISKSCVKLSPNNFSVVVPRRAKSAATLIALGAHEIHMGIMSELGPIDPQIGGLPALSMQNAMTLMAKLATDYPNSSDMLAQFLSAKVDIRVLGYFERINESACQYAERLLENKPLPPNVTPETLAERLVYHYKDHNFVIDSEESERLIGSNIIRQDTNEYNFANHIYESLDMLKFLLDLTLNKKFDFVGGISDGLVIRDKKHSQ